MSLSVPDRADRFSPHPLAAPSPCSNTQRLAHSCAPAARVSFQVSATAPCAARYVLVSSSAIALRPAALAGREAVAEGLEEVVVVLLVVVVVVVVLDEELEDEVDEDGRSEVDDEAPTAVAPVGVVRVEVEVDETDDDEVVGS